EQYQAIVRRAPGDVDGKVELARLFSAQGRFSDALSTIDSIPKSRLPASALTVKAASLLALGRKHDAAAVVQSAKESPAVEIELAEVFLQGQAAELALRALDQAAIEKHPLPARALYLRGSALQASGDTAGATRELNRALEQDPKSVPALVAMASIY